MTTSAKNKMSVIDMYPWFYENEMILYLDIPYKQINTFTFDFNKKKSYHFKQTKINFNKHFFIIMHSKFSKSKFNKRQDLIENEIR